MNGLAAEQGVAVWTHDYLVDPHPTYGGRPGGGGALGLRGMAVAPLRAPEGEIFGTLAISWEHPRDTTPEEIELLRAWPISQPSPSPTPGCTSR